MMAAAEPVRAAAEPGPATARSFAAGPAPTVKWLVMTWATYGEFLAFATVLVLIPGPDFAVVTKNTLAAGRRRGRWAAVGVAFGGWRQGFLSDITNPKVLIFYLAVLPQFLVPGASPGWVLAFAWSHALLSLAYLLVLTAGLNRARQILARRKVRRAMDGVTGAVLLGFSARLAAEHA